MSTQTDAEVAIQAAEAGAAVVRAKYGVPLARYDKSPTDFATEADLEAERAILDVLRAARPDDAVIGEEYGADGQAARTWLVDPLCGTLNFAATTPHFSVNVALRSAGQTVAAAVSHPPSGEVYWADTDAFGILGRDRSATSTATSLVDINADGPLDRPFVGAQLAADPDLRATFSPRVESTTLALAWVATGQRHAYVTDGHHEHSVHFAAGIALCVAAGVAITDFDGAPVHTGPGIVAARDPEAHATLLKLVARHRTT